MLKLSSAVRVWCVCCVGVSASATEFTPQLDNFASVT